MVCTRVEVSQSYVAPGEAVELKALLLTESLEGEVSKGIRIDVGGVGSDLYLGFKAKVIPRFVHAEDPGAVYPVQAGETLSVNLNFRDAKNMNWEKAECSNSLAWLQGAVAPDRDGGYELKVDCDTKSFDVESGYYQGLQSLTLAEERVETLISLFVENDYVLSPKELIFRKSAASQRQVLYYKANSPKALIKKVHLDHTHFRTEVRPEYSPGEYRIYVYGRGLEGYNESDAEIRIETVDASFREVTIPLLVKP